MADPRFIRVNPSDELPARAKFRLAFRDVLDFGELVWSLTPPLSLTEKAESFYTKLSGGALAYPASQPVIGENGTVFVIDVRIKSDVTMIPVRNAMAVIEDTVPGLELVSVELVPLDSGTEADTKGREQTFLAAADVDASRDWDANPFNAPADAAKRAAAGVGTVAVLVGVIVVVMLAKGFRS